MINLLGVEVVVYEALAAARSRFKTAHFADMVDRGEDNQLRLRYMVMSLVGPSLQVRSGFQSGRSIVEF